MLLDDRLFTDEMLERFLSWFNDLSQLKYINTNQNKGITEKVRWLENNPCPIKDEIELSYNKGYGLKIIARNLGISYTQTRRLLPKIGIKIRRGRDITTDITNEFRQRKAQFEAETKTGWLSRDIHRKNLQRGIQGLYFNQSRKKHVWLRSTYEYIFAKWLDRTNHYWDVEVCRYDLPNGELYTPDFFIFDKNDEIIKIIEIKGYWRNRDYKSSMLQEMMPNIEIVTIYDIHQFIQEGMSYSKEQSTWKKERTANVES